MTKTQESAIGKFLPKDTSKLDPARLLEMAKAIFTFLKALGVPIPDILNFLSKRGLPDPRQKV